MGSYVRGFFKAGHLPTAVSGTLLLALALGAGYVHVAQVTPYRRSVISLTPWNSEAVATAKAAVANGTAVTSTADEHTRGPLTIAYLLNAAAVAIAIFHAGWAPLYQNTSTMRYKDILQDALASFGWSFLSLHHVANLSLLVLLMWGWPALARLAPLALLLPASHFALRLLPALPPSIHFKLGLYVDLLSHTPLALLYAWRAVTLSAPWELLGTAAEVLHLLSVVPEALTHRGWFKPADGPSDSWLNPRGVPQEQEGSEVEMMQVELLEVEERSGEATPRRRGRKPRSAKVSPAAQGSEEPAAPTVSLDTIGARVRARHEGVELQEDEGVQQQQQQPTRSTRSTRSRIGAAAAGGPTPTMTPPHMAAGSGGVYGSTSRRGRGAGHGATSSRRGGAQAGAEGGVMVVEEAEEHEGTPEAPAVHPIGDQPEGVLGKLRRRLFQGASPVEANLDEAALGDAGLEGYTEAEVEVIEGEIEEVEEEPEGVLGKAGGALQQQAKKAMRNMKGANPYALLVLINALSYLALGGLIAITAAPPPLLNPLAAASHTVADLAKTVSNVTQHHAAASIYTAGPASVAPQMPFSLLNSPL